MKATKYITPLNIPEGKSGDFSIKHKIIPSGQDLPLVHMRAALYTGEATKSVKYQVSTR